MKRTFQTMVLAAGLASATAFAQDTATITQLGSNGVAAINQVGNPGGTRATIAQNSGDGNAATIDQRALGIAPGSPADTTIATVTQEGNFNSASVDQHDSNRSFAEVFQLGERNQTSMVQAATDLGDVRSRQSGSDNVATIAETGTISDTSAFGPGAFIQQEGNGNRASVAKFRTHDLAAVATQTGDLNTADFVQTGESGDAGTLQVGNRNAVTVTQDSGGFVSLLLSQIGDDNTVRASQVNVANSFLGIDQFGTGNLMVVNQHDGIFLSISATQIGNFNTSNFDQSGTNGFVLTDQRGDNNLIDVTQHTTAPGPDTDTVLINQNSSFNVAKVSQVGAGFTATITQGGGNGNVATINQHF